jgi:hypothetical protein
VNEYLLYLPKCVLYSYDLGMDDDATIARKIQAESDAEFARTLQREMNSGSDRPVGKMKVVGSDEDGREVLEDERGNRFVRRKPAKKDKEEREPKEEKEETKCILM